MKKVNSLLILFLLPIIFQAALFLPRTSAEEPSLEAYGRACLAVEETSLEGQGPAVHTVAFDKNSKPGPGKRLVLYTDANTDEFALVVAFNDKNPGLAQADGQGLPDRAAGGGPYKLAQADGQGLPDRAAGGGSYKLANNWLPQLVELKAWEELSLPAPPITWSWHEGSEPFEIYVIFFKKTFPEISELAILVTAMQNSGAGTKLLDLQTRKLRDRINRWMGGQNPNDFHAGVVPSAWGGTLRGNRFPWRKQAQKAILSNRGHALLIYRYDT